LALSPIRTVHPAQADSVGKVERFGNECDNDLDGAIIGGLIGGSPAILAFVLAGNDDTGGEKYIPLAYVGLLGGIAGFIIGLGVDSADCSSMNLSEPELRKLIFLGEESAMERLERE
jgi:hypothetical protein